MARAKTPRLYFSFRSPYSWLGVEKLRRLSPETLDALEWIPFFDPDPATDELLTAASAQFHYVQMSRAKHFYLLMDTKRLAAAMELPMAWPIDVDPWWELPHLGWLAAQRAGRAREFYTAVIEARWHRGENICTEPVIRAVAERAGLDPDVVAGAPDDPELRRAGVEALTAAYHDDVFGIPYLKHGRQRFWGFDRVEAFLDHWRSSSPAEPQSVPAGSRGYDTDTAGGCG